VGIDVSLSLDPLAWRFLESGAPDQEDVQYLRLCVCNLWTSLGWFVGAIRSASGLEVVPATCEVSV